MKKIMILFTALIFAAPAFAQPHWSQRAYSNGFDKGKGIAVDNSGSVYVTGLFFDKGIFGTDTLVSNVPSNFDCFVAKYDSTGVLRWAQHGGGTGTTETNGIAVDANGNIYVTGYFSGTVSFGSYALSSNGLKDVFVAACDSMGSWLWATGAGGIEDEEGNAIALNSSGEILITGYFQNTATFGSDVLYSAGDNDVFVSKLDNTGTFIWTTSAGGSQRDNGSGIACDVNGYVYPTGSFKDTVDFSGTTLIGTNGQMFLAKYGPSGNLIWVKQEGGSGDDIAISIGINNLNQICVAGNFDGTTNFGGNNYSGQGATDVFVAHYDSAGNLIHFSEFGGTSDDIVYSVSVDSLGSTFVSGSFEDTINIGGNFFYSHGLRDGFVVQMDVAYNVSYSQNYGGTDDDVVIAIAADHKGRAISTGYFQNHSSFNGTSLSALAGGDVFVSTLNDVASSVPGYIPVRYHTSNSAIPSNNIVDIKCDNNNTIWVATAGSGIGSFDGAIWSNYNHSNSGLPQDNINSLFIDSVNNVWICSPDSGLIKFSSPNWTVYNSSTPGIPLENVTSVTAFSGGPMWIGTADGGCVKYNNLTWTVLDTATTAIPSDRVTTMNCDSSHHYWIGTKDAGIAMFDGTSFSVFDTSNSGIHDNLVNNVFVDEGNNIIWVCTPRGISTYDGTNWTSVTIGNLSTDDYISAINVTRTGTKAIASRKKGSTIQDGSIATSIHTNNALFDNNVTCITSDTVGNIWMGTQFNGLLELQILPTAIKELNAEKFSGVNIFPNPASSQATVKCGLAGAENYFISITDGNGKLVYRSQYKKNKNDAVEKRIYLRSLPSGIYSLSVSSENKNLSAKLLIVR